jgi:hypothetical protein
LSSLLGETTERLRRPRNRAPVNADPAQVVSFQSSPWVSTEIDDLANQGTVLMDAPHWV